MVYITEQVMFMCLIAIPKKGKDGGKIQVFEVCVCVLYVHIIERKINTPTHR